MRDDCASHWVVSEDLCPGVGAAFWRGAFDFGEDYMKGAEVHNITKKLPKPMLQHHL